MLRRSGKFATGVLAAFFVSVLLLAQSAFAAPVLLSETDKHSSITLSDDQLGANFSEYSHRAVRSTIAIQPESGFYYYEGRREVGAGNYGFGVATAAAPLNTFGGSTDQSIGVNTLGYIYYNNSSQIGSSGNADILANDTYGFAVDYRGVNPVLYVILDNAVFYTHVLDQVTDELFILAYGNNASSLVQQTINAGDDLAGGAFFYDVANVLAAAAIDGADQLILGWQDLASTNLSIVNGDVTSAVGSTVVLAASASNALGEDISSTIAWIDQATGLIGTGGSFTVTDSVVADHTILASVVDEFAQTIVTSVVVSFIDADADGDGLSDAEEAVLGTDINNSDTDADGLSDGDEVTIYLSNPLSSDSDADGLQDAYEIANGFDLNDNADATEDADADGYSNLDEQAAGTDPNNAESYPGAPNATRLNDQDKHASITLSEDGYGAEFSLSGHHGVRSDVAVEAGSGFYYFEGRREVSAGNYGFGVATSAVALDTFGGATDQSIGLNALGYLFYNNANLISADNTDVLAAEYYGVAVDYRGDHPIVYLIANDQLLHAQEMNAVSAPLYILVYGNNMNEGVQQTINTAASAFYYDYSGILNNANVSGVDHILAGWTPPPPVTDVMIATPSQQIELGQMLLISATAHNAQDMDISSIIQWSDDASGQASTGASFDFSADALGLHIITAQVLDEQSLPVVTTVAITVVAVDSDGDGLTDDVEDGLGTDSNNADSDGDGLPDGAEVNTYGSDPLQLDTDADGVPDGVEVELGSDLLVIDGDSDSDGDGFSNAGEYAQGTNPGNPFSYPGGPVATVLNQGDGHSSIIIGASGLGVTFTDESVRSVRSTVAIQPSSGWFYFEGRRETTKGNYGFAVASALASTEEGIGNDGQSVGISTDGSVIFNGADVEAFNDAVDSEYYGMAVDYSASTPIVYFIVTGDDGHRRVLTPRALPNVTTELYISVFGASLAGQAQATINAGDDPVNQPFYYPAHYELFTAGFFGAELMGQGWGALHSYNGREVVEDQAEVRFETDEYTGAGIELAADGLSAAYGIDEKMGVRSNQGMIGEFRYYEGVRLIDNIVKLGSGEGLGIGYGLITEYGRINPYPFDPEQASMSLNSVAGIWRNLNFIEDFDTSAYYHGFAVDYRGSRPIVHIIVDDDVIHSMTLPDVFTPLFPLIYANTQGAGVFANGANFGATPFYYNPKVALARANIDTRGFVSGWGAANSDIDADNLLDSDEVIYGSNVSDADSDGDGLRDGDEVHQYSTSPTNDDSDGDGMPDGYEVQVGQNPLLNDRLGDIDNDSETNINEYLVGSGLADAAPELTIHQGNRTINVGESITFTATVSDIYDGDLKASLLWTLEDSSEAASGESITLTPSVGFYRINAEVSDSSSLTATAFVTLTVVDPSAVDFDADGLTDQVEAILGTDPTLYDTDGDSLSDGEEVNLHSTNPLLPDTDADGMSDGFEVTYNLDANNPADAGLDADNDGRTNLEESLIGTDPNIADPEPVTEIIIDNEDASAEIISGYFSAYAAEERYGDSATYAVVGGVVDRFRFTPAIEQAGFYEVFAWNSCYSNRAVDVRHIIVHADGTDVIEVDQDCDTGTHGEWYSLGVYLFDLGSAGYLEITDANVSISGATYMGADAARFLLVDNNIAPVINLSASALTLLGGQPVELSATANDAEDGDLTNSIIWSDGDSNNAVGSSFNYIPVLGSHVLTATVSDLDGKVTVVSISVDVVADDNDGLTPAEEAILGTNPANADSDADGLIDGDEVNIFGTNPLASDTDNDGIDDSYEIENGFDPNNADDAVGDVDGDGISNLQEYLDGTDPLSAAPIEIIIDNGDPETSSVGSWSDYNGNESFGGASLWAAVGGVEDSYRFTPNIARAGTYEVYAWNSCYGDRATNVRHIVRHADGIETIEVDQDCDTGAHGEWFLLGSYPFAMGIEAYLEISDAGLTAATYMGADAARFVLTDSVVVPQVSIDISIFTLVYGNAVSLSATASDSVEGNITAFISWTNDLTADSATGGSFVFTPELGLNTVTATVTNLDGVEASATATINVVNSLDELDDDNDGLSNAAENDYGSDVNNPDTDGDGLTDGDEVNSFGTSPILVDTDADFMPDDFEISYGLDPLDAGDAEMDLDNDGLSNLEEFQQNSDPTVAPLVEIIIENGDAGTSSVGGWNDYYGNESYSDISQWASVGGEVDSYRFTPDIQVQGDYEVLVWNSCYSNRATNVPHIVQYDGGQSIVEVDQDCDTGTHGEWFSLGVFAFFSGSAGFVEITDDGLVSAATTYLGADSARFVRQ
jgi:hypothetical protein